MIPLAVEADRKLMDLPDMPSRGQDPGELLVWDLLTRIDPASPVRLVQAQAFLQGSDHLAALKIAESVLAAHPDSLPAAMIKAQALLDAQDLVPAKQALNAVFAVLDRCGQDLARLASLFRQVGDESAAERIEQAASLLRTIKEPEAIPAVEPLPVVPLLERAEVIPTETLASLYLTQGHRDQALEVYRQLAVQDPGNPKWPAMVAELTRPLTPTPAWTLEPELPSPEPGPKESALLPPVPESDLPSREPVPAEKLPPAAWVEPLGDKQPTISPGEPLIEPVTALISPGEPGRTPPLEPGWETLTAEEARPVIPPIEPPAIPVDTTGPVPLAFKTRDWGLAAEASGSPAQVPEHVVKEQKKQTLLRLTRLRDAARRLRQDSTLNP